MRFLNQVKAAEKHGPISHDEEKRVAEKHRAKMKQIQKLIEEAVQFVDDNQEVFDNLFSGQAWKAIQVIDALHGASHKISQVEL